MACQPTENLDGCMDEDPFELYSPDVELLPGRETLLTCSIPAEGKKFSIFPTDNIVCGRFLFIDSVYIEQTWQSDTLMFVGDWGRITNMPLKDNYYETVCEIGPNPNAVPRQITLDFPRLVRSKCLVINQAPNDSLKQEE